LGIDRRLLAEAPLSFRGRAFLGLRSLADLGAAVDEDHDEAAVGRVDQHNGGAFVGSAKQLDRPSPADRVIEVVLDLRRAAADSVGLGAGLAEAIGQLPSLAGCQLSAIASDIDVLQRCSCCEKGLLVAVFRELR
jgi:hypothetical protein